MSWAWLDWGRSIDWAPPGRSRSELTSHCERSTALSRIVAQHQTPGAGLGHLLPVFILNITLDITGVFAALDHPGFGAKARLPDRAEEMDVQIHGGERLVSFERAYEGQAHGSVRQIAKNAAVEGPHGIGVLRPRLKRSDRAAIADFTDRETDQLRNGSRRQGFPNQGVSCFLHDCYSPIDSLRTTCRSTPSCWHFLYRWLRSRPRALAVSVMWYLWRFSSASSSSRSNASTRSASVPVLGADTAAVEGSAISTKRPSMRAFSESSIRRSTTLRSSRTLPGH